MKKLSLILFSLILSPVLAYSATGGGSAVGIRRANRGAVLSVNGQKGNVTVSAGGGDNFGSHVATQTVLIGTTVVQDYALTVSTSVNAPGPIFSVKAGTNTTFEVTHTSVTAGPGVTFQGDGSQLTGISAGGNNQQMNTSTVTLVSSAFDIAGAVFLATSPRVAIPGKVFTDARSTFNVVSIQAYTGTVSTATDANISFVLAESTPISSGQYHTISSTAEVVSSSGAAQIEFSTEISTSFTMFPRNSYSVLITSVPSGPSLPAENAKFLIRGWWSP